MPDEIRRVRGIALVAGVAVASTVSGCGTKDYTRSPPRAPVPIQITGVITSDRVTVSPNRIGGGPIVLLISNQTQMSHTVTLEGERTRERVGPVNPQDAATIQTDVTQGRYTISAGSERATSRSQQIKPAELIVGVRRPTGEDDLLRP